MTEALAKLIPVGVEILEPGQRTLRELADALECEHAAVEDAALDVLLHAIRAGKILLEARGQVPQGTWTQWMSDNFRGSRETANHYIRLAVYEDIVLARPWRRDDVGALGRNSGKATDKGDLWRAYHYLRGLPPATDGRAPRHSEELKEEARKLHRAGASYREIARLLGVSHHSVPRWCDRNYLERRRAEQNKAKRRQRAERERLKRETRDRAIARVKGPGSEAYALLRRATQLLDRAADEATEREPRAAFRLALTAAYKAEDEIVRALKVAA